MADSDGDRWLSPEKAGELLGVSGETVRRWAKAGRFRPGTVRRTAGGHRRIMQSEVERFGRELSEGNGDVAGNGDGARASAPPAVSGVRSVPGGGGAVPGVRFADGSACGAG